ncbi:MAG: pre-peptidase C-terminal domain-containing protein [Planctomycetaceae bacterium]
MENLETRSLLTGPTLVSVSPNFGNFIEPTGTVLQEQPRELTFRFNPGQMLDTTTLAGIQVVGSGFDGSFSNGNEITLLPGFRGLGEQPEDVVFRFAEPLPDDLYEIRINGNGVGGTALRNTSGEAFNGGINLTRQFDLDLGATVQAVVPQPVIREQKLSVLSVANLRDTDLVTINDGFRSVVFEFENTAINNGVSGTNTAVTFAPANSATTVASQLANRINATMSTRAGVTAVASGSTVTVTGRAFDAGVNVATLNPNTLSVVAGGLQQARDTVIVYFNKDALQTSSAENPAFYQLIDTSGTLVGADDSVQLPQSVAYDAATNKAILKFAAPIATGTFKLKVGSSIESNGTIGTASNVGKLFSSKDYVNVALIGDETAANDVDLYRVELVAGTVFTATVTAETGLDTALRLFNFTGAAIAPPGVVDLAATAGTEVLTYTATATGTYYLGISSKGNTTYAAATGANSTGGTTTGSYRVTLDVNTALAINDNNSSYTTATNLGVLAATGHTLTSQIQPQPIAIPQPVGAVDEPGHRNIPIGDNLHGVGPGNAYSPASALRTVNFYFPITYGTDPQGNTLFNQITENQKQRAREILEIYGDLFGFEVAETTNSGMGIITGDIRAAQPSYPITVSLGGGNVYITGVPDWGTSPYGGGWMGIALHEIGHSIGQSHSYDLPSNQGSGPIGEDQYPTAHDILHGQRINPNNANDIDLYRFDVTKAGKVSAEIVAERLAASSPLNAALRLYRQELNGSRTLIAQNDDYYSDDAFISMDLAIGTYFIGVTASGNMDYDPAISDTGFGGSSDGLYQLNLNISSAVTSTILDTTGTSLDGNADSKPGGDFEFFFRSDSTLLVDKSVTTNLTQALDAVQVTLRVNDVRMFPAAGPFDVFVEDERMTVTAVDAVNKRFTVTRAVGGTTLATHLMGVAVRPANSDGSAARPYGLISEALLAAKAGAGNIVRIVGNGGTDNSLTTASNNRPYLVGLTDSFAPLEDGSAFEIPKDVMVQIDAGAIVKLKNSVIDAGTSATGDDRSGGALQVLGTTAQRAFLTSYGNDAIGGDSDGVTPGAAAGDWGGLVFRQDSDWRAPDSAANPLLAGIFLNYVNQADISYGGGQAFVGSTQATFSPIHIVTSRPTITNKNVRFSASHAMSANPDSFDDSRGRIGPEIHGNVLTSNTNNGIFVRIATAFGQPIDRLNVTARFDDTDIVHIITENLEMVGSPGGSLNGVARIGGRLAIDPGTVVKLSGARIEAMRGSAHLVAEGTPQNPVILTSLLDDRFGAGGTFDTTGNGSTTLPSPGDWGGLVFNAVSRGSIDHALIAYAGGETPIAGGVSRFNTIEMHDRAKVRVANSVLEFNANGQASDNRDSRGTNSAATIFVRQSQPIIVNNVFRNNSGSIIEINANAMISDVKKDYGRTTGALDVGAPFGRSALQPMVQFADNSGPLVRLNRIVNTTSNAAINGMTIRGTTLTEESVWDDTDIVHVLQSEIIVNQHHSLSGLTLKSNPGESLVVKLFGPTAGFTADGVLLDTEDRIGGSVYLVGRPNFPVVLTSLRDDSVGSSLGLDGFPLTDTNNDGIDLYDNVDPSVYTPDGLDDITGAPFTGSVPAPGNWRSLKFTQDSNDRNVKLLFEAESANNGGLDINGNPGQAEFLGVLAPDYKSGDDNRSLGIELHGNISADSTVDVDVYSFKFVGNNSREVWIDIDRTRGASLDAVVELVQANGVVLARSEDRNIRTGLAQPLTKNAYDGDDFYTQNFHDPGMRVIMPNTGGAEGTFFIRVTSKNGTTSGEYQMQLRLRQKDEKAGSTVRYADLRYATNGVEIIGLPAHSPLLGESGEFVNAAGNEVSSNNSPAAAVQLGNLLQSDQTTFSVAGRMQSATDQDFFQFNLDYATTIFGGDIQAIAGVNGGDKTWSTVFDLDYANGLTRTDSNMVVWRYDAATGSAIPILIGRESNIIDDQPAVGQGNDLDDLTRGTVGKLDPFIGPVQLPTGIPGSTTNYQVSVLTNQQLLTQLNQTYQSTANNQLLRLEPVNSVTRIVEDHIGFQGYNSQEKPILPTTTGGLINVTTTVGLSTNVQTFDLSDVPLFVSGADRLRTYNPYFGQQTSEIIATPGITDFQTQDIVMRSDGTLWAYQRVTRANNNDNGTAGRLVRLNTGTGAVTVVGNDNVLGTVPTPAVIAANVNNTNPDFDELTFTDEVDALAWERSGGSGNNAQYALYYSVRENGSGGSINSKLYRANPDNGSVAKDANNQIGVRGDIQYAGVTFASWNTSVFDTATPPNSATIHVETRAAGTAGNSVTFSLNSTGANNANITVNAGGSSVSVTAGITATAQEIVDAINSNGGARTLVTAGVTSGGTGVAAAGVGGTTFSPGTQGAAGILKGNVTGMAFSKFLGDTSLTDDTELLYGVTSAGEFISINTTVNGSATLLRDFRATGFAGLSFTGLALGPQNVNNGALKNTLFAMASDGRLFAINTAGTPQAVFTGGASVIATGMTNPTGLAFSPLDFNLWHTTTRQAGEVGHGINPLYDDSRTPDSEDSDVVDGQGNTRTQNQQDGGASLYFGLEEFNNGTSPYLNYQDTNSQFGIRSNDFQRDLTAGSIGNNYDLPGGALGSVITNPFNLTSDTGAQSIVDRPTLYFNYFLSSEDQNTFAPDGTMRDAARVFISTNGGTQWELLATNNVPAGVAGGNAQNENSFTEVPDFISHSLDADSDNRDQQQIQPLWDNSGTWRQARVDLGKYAGRTGLRLRFDFTTAGTILDLTSSPVANPGEDTNLVGTNNSTTHPGLGGGIINNPLLNLDEYGNLNDPRRGQNNAFEGFYIDDLIIGWTERGEAITAATNNTAVFTVPQDPGEMAPQQILTGPYQLEIRRGYEFGAPGDADEPGIQIGTTVDTNRQFIPADLGWLLLRKILNQGRLRLSGGNLSGDSPWRIQYFDYRSEGWCGCASQLWSEVRANFGVPEFYDGHCAQHGNWSAHVPVQVHAGGGTRQVPGLYRWCRRRCGGI